MYHVSAFPFIMSSGKGWNAACLFHCLVYVYLVLSILQGARSCFTPVLLPLGLPTSTRLPACPPQTSASPQQWNQPPLALLPPVQRPPRFCRSQSQGLMKVKALSPALVRLYERDNVLRDHSRRKQKRQCCTVACSLWHVGCLLSANQCKASLAELCGLRSKPSTHLVKHPETEGEVGNLQCLIKWYKHQKGTTCTPLQLPSPTWSCWVKELDYLLVPM